MGFSPCEAAWKDKASRGSGKIVVAGGISLIAGRFPLVLLFPGGSQKDPALADAKPNKAFNYWIFRSIFQE